ncbi:MAG: Nif3-like dinuclear metal center hexameric protein [Thermodesulfobacteria bacterium]|nr:Nif3-like dinuclear metal center hexameric protein [Thermodesulfobacteriota bacterium]
MEPSVQDIENALFDWAPKPLAEEWDNVGLQCGDPDEKVKNIVLALDVTPQLLAFALENEADLVISHHPLIFKPLSSLNLKEYTARLLAGFLRHDISVISMHTNLDSAKGGVNDRLCSLLDIVDTRPLLPNPNMPECGLGRVGRLATQMRQEELLSHVAHRLNLGHVPYAGSAKGPITTVAVCSGSGSTLFEEAMKSGAQAFVTGEIKHSVAIKAQAYDILVIDGGHFHTERPVVKDLKEFLSKRALEEGWDISVEIFHNETAPLGLWPRQKT